MTDLFIRIESDMMNRRFLSENPVTKSLAACTMSLKGGQEVLLQYCRLPEEIAAILLTAAAHFPHRSPVRQELARNVAQEKGCATGKVAHVDILKHMLRRDLGIDASHVVGSDATERFIAELHLGMAVNPSYALGQAFALEASAVPELSIVVGPLVNTVARLAGHDAPISQEALLEKGAYKLKVIRSRSDALAMTADHWFAMHVKDFEVGHRDFLRHHAMSFLLRDGNGDAFVAGFTNVMDLMDDWWSSLAA